MGRITIGNRCKAKPDWPESTGKLRKSFIQLGADCNRMEHPIRIEETCHSVYCLKYTFAGGAKPRQSIAYAQKCLDCEEDKTIKETLIFPLEKQI